MWASRSSLSLRFAPDRLAPVRRTLSASIMVGTDGSEGVRAGAFAGAASVLVNRARERGGSLIDVGSHGRSGVPRIALGSVAVAIVRNASAPVLVAGPRWVDAR